MAKVYQLSQCYQRGSSCRCNKLCRPSTYKLIGLDSDIELTPVNHFSQRALISRNSLPAQFGDFNGLRVFGKCLNEYSF